MHNKQEKKEHYKKSMKKVEMKKRMADKMSGKKYKVNIEQGMKQHRDYLNLK